MTVLRFSALIKIVVIACTLFIASVSSASIDNADNPLNYSKEQSKTATEIIKQLSNRHYNSLKIDDAISARIYDMYLNRLDSNKSFFLQSDIDELEKNRYILDDTLLDGNLTPAYSIFNRYQQRLIERLGKIIEQLPEMVANMDFSLNEELLIDRENSAWPKDKKEADNLWRKIVKSRVISLRIAKKDPDEIVPLLQKRYQNQLNRVKQSNSEDAFQLYMNSVTALYDPHTNYLSPSTSENFNINMSLSLEGIGAVLQSEDEFTKVVRLVHAGPADKAGKLHPADKIVAVAQAKGEFQDIIGMRLDEVVQLIRGPKGSVVRLQIIPSGAKTDDETTVIEIVRDKVKLEEQSAKKKVLDIYHNNKLSRIGIIDVPAFYIDFEALRAGDLNYKSTTRDVKKLLTELIDDGVDGIIIDLRNNGGGSLQEANQLTGLFIEQGPTVQIRHSNSRVYRDGKRNSSAFYDGPLAVLINRLSASASEIFAGAIQDYHRGIVVGTQSFGKGTVQSLSPLNQGQLKITESKFYRISGESTQHRGVVPDIEFPAIYDKEKIGESSLDNALPWDRIDPIRHRLYYNIPSIVPQLISKHEQRMKTDPDFIFLNEQLDLMEEARAITSIQLNEQLRIAETESEKQKALEIENKRRIAKGLKPIEKLDSNEEELAVHDTDAISSDDKDNEKETEKDKEVDPLLTETGHILLDALPIYQPRKIAVAQ
jgi:carboxyl-terminal processing protease